MPRSVLRPRHSVGDVHPNSTARRVAEVLGLTLGERLAGGEFGAYAAETAAGARRVLKVMPPHPALSLEEVQRAAALVEVLHAAGHPVPAYDAVGEFEGGVPGV